MFEAVIDPDESTRWFDVYLVNDMNPDWAADCGRSNSCVPRLKAVPDNVLNRRRSEGKLTALAKGDVMLGSSKSALAETVKIMGYLGTHFIRGDLLAAWINPQVQDDARGAAAMLRSGKKCVAFSEAMNGLRGQGFHYVESCEQVRMRRRYRSYERKTPVLWRDGKLYGVKQYGSRGPTRYYELGSKLAKATEERVRLDNAIRGLEGLRPEYGFEPFIGYKMRVSREFIQFYQHPMSGIYAYGDAGAVRELEDARRESIRAVAAALGVPGNMLNIHLFSGDSNDEKSRFNPEMVLAARRRWPVPYRLVYGLDVEFGLRPGKLQTRRLLSDAGYCRYMAMRGKPDLLIDYRAWRKLRNKRLQELEADNG